MTRHADQAVLVLLEFDMRILVTGNPGVGKTSVMYDVLDALYEKSDWMCVIRYMDTFLSEGEESGVISHVSAASTLKDEFNAVSDGFTYSRDLIYAGLKSDSDYICEYPFGENPAPEHAAFFDVILKVSVKDEWGMSNVEVLKDRRGTKRGQKFYFEFIDGEPEDRIKLKFRPVRFDLGA